MDASKNEEDADIPFARLISAADVSQPNVKSWQLSNFEQVKKNKVEKLNQAVVQKMRQEAAPLIEQQTELIKKEAFEQAQQAGQKSGFDQGYAEGYAQGQQQAQQEAQAVLSDQMDYLDHLIGTLQTPLAHVSAEIYQALAGLSLNLAQKMISSELSQNSNQILDAIKQTLELLPEDALELTIDLHPDDLSVVEQYAEHFQKKWQLQASDHLQPGACRVRHQASVIENNWHKQLQLLINQTLDQVHSQVKAQQTQAQ